MVQTFIIDWPVLILIGLIFGYGIKGKPNGSVLLTRAFVSGKIIITLFVVLVYYSYLLAPDWMWMYFVKGSDVPLWIVIYVLVLYYFAYAVGFFLKIETEKISRFLPPFYMLLMLVAEFAVTLPLKARYLNVGTLEEFQAGQAIPLAEHAVGRVPGTLTLLLIPLGIILLYWSRRQKQRSTLS